MWARVGIFVAALACTVGAIIGSLGTWAHQGGIAYAGTDANAGVTTLVAAILALAFLAVATWTASRWFAVVALIPAGVAATIPSYRLADIAHFVGGSGNATAAWGVWVAAVFAGILFLLCLVHVFLPPPAGTPAADERP